MVADIGRYQSRGEADSVGVLRHSSPCLSSLALLTAGVNLSSQNFERTTRRRLRPEKEVGIALANSLVCCQC